MKKIYDPLRLVIKQNKEERGPYNLGLVKGKEIGQTKEQDELYHY